MTVFAFYIICVALAMPLMAFGTWWDMKHDRTSTLTVGNILLGIFLGLCPVLNAFVVVFLTGWIIFDVCPKIVVFGPEGRSTSRWAEDIGQGKSKDTK